MINDKSLKKDVFIQWMIAEQGITSLLITVDSIKNHTETSAWCEINFISLYNYLDQPYNIQIIMQYILHMHQCKVACVYFLNISNPKRRK